MEEDPLSKINPNIRRSLIPTTLENTWDRALDQADERIDTDGMFSREDEERLRKLEIVAYFFGLDVYKW